MDSNNYCVIMAGGIGSRFWPISRIERPKQFLDILGTGKTFIRSTYERFANFIPRENFLVVTNEQYRALVAEQIPELAPHQILGEPLGRNTAPCIAYAAFHLRAMNPEATMIVAPSDHLILNEAEFVTAMKECVAFVRSHHNIMTIGIEPTRPDTGYGYIQIAERNGIVPVKTFTEKPNEELAKAFVASGEFFWNSGIFIWELPTILEAFRNYLPEMYQLFESEADRFNTPDEVAAIARIYPECRGISIDYGVIEKAENVYVRCSSFGWSDVGTWGSLYQYLGKDDKGNVAPAGAVLNDTANCLVKAPEGKLVVIDGLQDCIVVDTPDVLMICPKNKEQEIKQMTNYLKFNGGEKFL